MNITRIDDYRREKAMRNHPAGKARISKRNADRERTLARKTARSFKHSLRTV